MTDFLFDKETLNPDVLIIGSGVGGSTFARTIAPSGAKILIVERGDYLTVTPDMLNETYIHRDGKFISKETWYKESGAPFNPWIYYYVGGNTKFFGAVMPRYKPDIKTTTVINSIFGISIREKPIPIAIEQKIAPLTKLFGTI